jgi:hypothetical protein
VRSGLTRFGSGLWRRFSLRIYPNLGTGSRAQQLCDFLCRERLPTILDLRYASFLESASGEDVTRRGCYAFALVLLSLLLSFSSVSASSLATEVRPDRRSCTAIRLPSWTVDWAGPSSCELQFRSSNNKLLVGTYCGVKPGIEAHSPDNYSFKPGTSKVGKASAEEWSRADPLPNVRVAPHDAKIVKGLHSLIYQGKQLPITGGLDQISWVPLRLSTKGSFIAVNSWNGILRLDDSMNFRGLMKGQYYTEIYDVSSGQLALAISGNFRQRDIFSMFQRSAWISDRYFVLPEDGWRAFSRFLICDVQPAAHAKAAAGGEKHAED